MRNSCVHSRYSSADAIQGHASVIVEQALCGGGVVCVTGTAHTCMHAHRYILIVVMLVLLCADFEALGEEGQVSVHWSELWEAAS